METLTYTVDFLSPGEVPVAGFIHSDHRSIGEQPYYPRPYPRHVARFHFRILPRPIDRRESVPEGTIVAKCLRIQAKQHQLEFVFIDQQATNGEKFLRQNANLNPRSILGRDHRLNSELKLRISISLLSGPNANPDPDNEVIGHE